MLRALTYAATLCLLIPLQAAGAPPNSSPSAQAGAPAGTAIDIAVARALQQQKVEEEARLDRMPDVFRCAQMTWLKPIECKELNRQAKINPGAPMRAHTADGLEIVFPPGVSSAEMMHVLLGTEESALGYLQDMERLKKHHEKAAANYRKALARVDGTSGVFDSFESYMAAPDPEINQDVLVVNVFYESTCPACESYFPALVALQKKYPRLKVFLFQIDKNADALKRVRSSTNLNARIMTDGELSTMKSQGLTKWPYTLIDNPQIKRRIAKYGVIPVSHMETALARLSTLSAVSGAAQ